jgi:hypothetical protein
VLRVLRVAVLLYVLAFVGVGTLIDSAESTNWDYALRVVVYPVAGDSSAAVAAHITELSDARFESVGAFFTREARHFELSLERPVRLTLAPERGIRIPALRPGASRFDVLIWSLQMRWKTWRVAWDSNLPKPDITLFAVFHEVRENRMLDNSTALRKGLIAIAHVFADTHQAGSNDVVMAHELLHTLGATDKYALRTLQPNYPSGYMEPDRQPLHPQRFTEIMAGRRAVSSDQAEMPESLRNVRVGAMTAREIGWLTSE